MPPEPAEGRWTIWKSGLKSVAVAGPNCNGVSVVPCNDAAVERLAQHLYDNDEDRVRPEGGSDWAREPDGYKGLYRDRAREAVRVLATERYS